MESTRQKKVSRLIQKELSVIFQKEAQHLFNKVILSITAVRISPDLSYAKVFISIFPVKEPEKVLLIVKKYNSIFRKALAKNIRNQLRIVPELDFFLDDSAEYSEEINRLLSK